MSFASTIFLLGAAAVAGPILAHLLAKPRYRRVPFTMLAFLQVSSKDVQARRKLRNLLLLLLRCLIVAGIAMLFAGPRLLGDPAVETPQKLYYLALDDSVSMTYRGPGGSYFDQMLTQAARVISGADEGALFNIHAMASGRWGKNLTEAAALAALKRLKPVPQKASPADFLSQLKAARRRLNHNAEFTAAILSDFTPEMLRELAGVDEPVFVESATHVYLKTPGPVTNTCIVAARLTRVGADSLEVAVTVENYGSEPVERTLVAKDARARRDVPLLQTALTLAANERRQVNMAIPAGAETLSGPDIQVEVSLAEADPLAADDRFYLAAGLPEKRRTNVVLFGAGARELFLLKTAVETIGSHDPFTVVNCTENYYGALRPGYLIDADVAMFAGVRDLLADREADLASFLAKGARAVFFLTKGSSASALTRLAAGGILPASVGALKTQETSPEAAPCAPGALAALGAQGEIVALRKYRLDNVLLSGFFECEPAARGQVLWNLKTGDPFLIVRRVGDGSSVLVNTSADDSLGGLTKSPAAVAFIRLLVGRAAVPVGRSFTCAEPITIPATAAEIRDAGAGRPVWVLKPSGESLEAAVSQSLLVAACGDETGWLSTVAKPVRCAGVNLPEGETDMAKADDQTVALMAARAIQEMQKNLIEAGDGEEGRTYVPIWRYFAWLVLALVLVEVFIANRTQR